jgi:hypothetical protein
MPTAHSTGGCVLSGANTGLQSLRVLRSFRLFLLMAKLPGLVGLLDTVIHCLKPAISIGLLFMMLLYVYAIAGMQLFGDAGTDHDFYDENNNFRTFFNSCKLLVQVTTGMNYMWLCADLAQEGIDDPTTPNIIERNDPNTLFCYFFSFYVISVRQN